MANNIITAVFSSSNITYTKPAYQYDYGMILQFSGIDLPQAYEVHFSNTEFCGESISQIGDETGVTIPDEMFLNGNPIYAWTYLHTGEDDGETVYKAVISVNKRARPSDLEPTPVQQDAITQAIAALNVAVEQTAQDVIDAGAAKDAAETAQGLAEDARDAAVVAQGKAEDAQEAAETAQGKAEEAQEAAEAAAGSVLGLTADATVDANVGTPSVEVDVSTVSDHKNMTFTFKNLKGQPGEAGSQGPAGPAGPVGPAGSKGDPGDPGQDGISPTITVTEISGGHNVEITDAQGTTDFDVMDGQSGLITDYVAEEKTPYLFRPSANGLANVISEKDMIVGGTVAWNQLVSSLRVSGTVNGLTFTNSDNISLKVEGTCSATDNYTIAYFSGFVETHVYLFLSGVNRTADYELYINGSVPPVGSDGVIRKKDSNNLSFGFRVYNGATVSITLKPQLIDLTQMFGSTIADYIYTLESGSSGSGIAKLKEWGFFTKDYYPYNSGDLQSVQTSEHRMVGFNQCPFNLTKGTPASAFDATKCVRVIKGQTYELSHGNVTKATTWRNAFSCFDLDGNRIYTGSDITMISGQMGGNQSGKYYVDGTNSTLKSEIFTVKFDGYIQPFILLGDIANDSVAEETCLHFNGIRNGEYEPYSVHSYPLDSDLVLRGFLKLDASNNLYYYGDTYESNGTVTRRFGIVDLGTLNWSYRSANGFFYAPHGTLSSSAVGRLYVCSHSKFIYQHLSMNTAWTDGIEGLWVDPDAVSSTSRIYAKDSAYTDAQTFTAAMSGKYLVYELDVSAFTTETADPYSEYQIVDADGTEEYVDERTVPIPVGHDTYYQQAVDVPQLPTADGSYRLALSLTGNTATASWEYVAQAEMKAQTNIPSGKYFSVGGRLFVSTQAIAQGEQIVVGTNCSEVSLADALNQINS